MRDKICGVIYGSIFLAYFMIVVPTSGIVLLYITEGAVTHGLIIIGMMVLHMHIAAIFFNADSRLLAVTSLISLVSCLMYMDWGNIMLPLFLLIN